MENRIYIDGRAIGDNCKPYIIAEISANHGGSIEHAKETISMAKSAGVDAVKLQTYTPDTMTLNIKTGDFKIEGGLWDGYSLYDLYKEAHTPFEWHKELFEYARSIGITLFSTPFDETAIELLEELGTPAYKVASFEATDIPLLQAIGRTKKPVILSTGLSNEQEISDAILALTTSGTEQLAVLHCVSGYPTSTDQANVNTLNLIKRNWPNVIPGLSDHTMSPITSVTAVALGAKVIEKHVIVDRKRGGPDSSFSLEPEELKELVELISIAHESLGLASFELKEAEKDNLKFRRSIYISKNVKKGDQLSKDNVRRIRPGYGLAPKYYEDVLGKVFIRDFPIGTALKLEYIR